MIKYGLDIHVFQDTIFDCDPYSLLKYFREQDIDIANMCPISFEISISNGYIEAIKLWIEAGYDFNCKCPNDRTPIANALIHNKLDIVYLLIDNGVKINLDEDKVIDYLCYHKNLDFFKYIIEHELNFEKYIESFLYGYISHGYFIAVDYLLSLGNKINIDHIIISRDDVEILNYLIDYGINIFASDKIFSNCVTKQFTDCIIYFIEHDTSFNKYNSLIETNGENEKLIKYLIENGYDIYNNCSHVLHCTKKEEIIKYVIDITGNIHCDNDYVLRMACERGDFNVVQYALDNGADINVMNNLVKDDFASEVIQCLLNNGINFNAFNKNVFLKLSDLETVKMMINMGYNYKPLLKEVVCKNIKNQDDHGFTIAKYFLDLENNFELTTYALEKYIEHFNREVYWKWNFNGLSFCNL